jgi:hypothetical protein
MSADATHWLLNTTTRPVELHLPSRVAVVAAMGAVLSSKEDLESAQVGALVASGVLVVREIVPATPSEDTKEPPAERARTSRRGAASGTRGRKGAGGGAS